MWLTNKRFEYVSQRSVTVVHWCLLCKQFEYTTLRYAPLFFSFSFFFPLFLSLHNEAASESRVAIVHRDRDPRIH